jgi:hypothetical protein
VYDPTYEPGVFNRVKWKCEVDGIQWEAIYYDANTNIDHRRNEFYWTLIRTQGDATLTGAGKTVTLAIVDML